MSAGVVLTWKGVVACDLQGGIGRDGGLPWHLPNDLKRFRAQTIGRPILMGRRTWMSIGRPLPGRLSLVLTRTPTASNDAALCFVTSLDEAAASAAAWMQAQAPTVPRELCVVGGAAVYGLAAPRIDQWHLTLVHARDLGCDTHLTPLVRRNWEVVTRHDHPADAAHAWAQTELVLQRVHRDQGPTVPFAEWLRPSPA